VRGEACSASRGSRRRGTSWSRTSRDRSLREEATSCFFKRIYSQPGVILFLFFSLERNAAYGDSRVAFGPSDEDDEAERERFLDMDGERENRIGSTDCEETAETRVLSAHGPLVRSWGWSIIRLFLHYTHKLMYIPLFGPCNVI
jgi:hypothetical protein